MNRIFILFLVAITFLSCQKELIDINDLPFTDSDLNLEIVVSGFVSNEKSKCKITLSRPILISGDIDFVPLNEAIVFLNDGIDTFAFELVNDKGDYFSLDSIEGIVGHEYTLMVTYNSKLYTASDVLPEVSNENAFPIHNVQYFPNEDFVQIMISEHNFGYQVPNIWNCIEGTYDSLNTFHLPHKDLKDLYNMRIYSHIGSLPQGVFPAGTWSTFASGLANDSLEIVKMSISNSYYEYLLSVFNETHWKAGMFSTIAGNVKTNVSEGGTGYFYAINAERERYAYGHLAGIQ
ncbi:MAG TPA: DUF4249 family protein [Tenuifilaceae bacterium]|nr:DUF4249 family protein [Tenuifilaceae bacterium]HPJ47190.1 DUF4249 family protein [Tenuifilaceae bacterium]HPQ35366.1 DUF4249 family protein [Tenuifilaceae bacterium]HRX69485.1 DUF4249 family protein [Tenuifilaceae bacterium]